MALLLAILGFPAPGNGALIPNLVVAAHTPGKELLDRLGMWGGLGSGILDDDWISLYQHPSLIHLLEVVTANFMMLAFFFVLALMAARWCLNLRSAGGLISTLKCNTEGQRA